MTRTIGGIIHWLDTYVAQICQIFVVLVCFQRNWCLIKSILASHCRLICIRKLAILGFHFALNTLILEIICGKSGRLIINLIGLNWRGGGLQLFHVEILIFLVLELLIKLWILCIFKTEKVCRILSLGNTLRILKVSIFEQICIKGQIDFIFLFCPTILCSIFHQTRLEFVRGDIRSWSAMERFCGNPNHAFLLRTWSGCTLFAHLLSNKRIAFIAEGSWMVTGSFLKSCHAAKTSFQVIKVDNLGLFTNLFDRLLKRDLVRRLRFLNDFLLFSNWYLAIVWEAIHVSSLNWGFCLEILGENGRLTSWSLILWDHRRLDTLELPLQI